ncbi:hypothetical protein BKI52_17820 [marine bacterium AO1-C]|nr:hypothetical protein BKI52_17820 [marine bacterium AO1-C]
MKQLPLHIDLFAIFIFLGTMQGYFLSFFFLSGQQRKIISNRILGLTILAFVLSLTEVLMGYTNYMGRIPWIVDFSEPLNFALGPLLFVYVYTQVYPRFDKHLWWHFVFFGFYAIYIAVFWHSQSLDLKYNGFITAFHPNQPELYRQATLGLPEDPFHIRRYVNHLTLVHFLLYAGLTLVLIRNAFAKAQLTFWAKTDPVLSWARKLAIQFSLVTIVFIIVKVSFKNDLGDHIIAAHVAFLIYGISFYVIRQSVFFQEKQSNLLLNGSTGKYQKSSLSVEKEQHALDKLKRLMSTEKPFLENTLSLPILAKKLAISTHHLSQIINDNLKQSFFEMLASYRIQEAQRILTDSTQQHLKIEEIAEQVGYNSKSAFNAAFKKITGQTPSQYRKQTLTSKTS